MPTAAEVKRSEKKYAFDERNLRAHYLDPKAYNFATQTLRFHANSLVRMALRGGVIDVASGAGNIWKKVLFRSPRISSLVCVDLSEASLAQGRETIKDPRVSFRTLSAYCVGQEYEGKFDHILMRGALHHFEYAQLALNNAAQALRGNGNLILLDVLGYEYEEADRLFAMITRMRQPADYKFYSWSELERMLAQAKFNLTSFTTYNFRLDLKRWLAEYEAAEAVSTLFERAAAKAKGAFGYRKVKGRKVVRFTAYCLVATKT